MIKLFVAALCALAITFSGVARAAISQSNDLNFISGTGTASDGLAFLDMSFSVGLSEVEALANARLTYVDARLATAAEFDDLYLAAGVNWHGLLRASDGFTPGANGYLARLDDGVKLLHSVLGSTYSDSTSSGTAIWTDPDSISATSSTRDYISMNSDGVSLVQNSFFNAPNSTLGWLLVVASVQAPITQVPEPSTGILLSLGILGLGVRRRGAAAQLNTRR
jgi:hypothetical protein